MAQVSHVERVARDHLGKVNRWSAAAVQEHVEEAFATWMERSRRDWTLDPSILEDADIELHRPPEASTRSPVAEVRLAKERREDLDREPGDGNWVPKSFVQRFGL